MGAVLPGVSSEEVCEVERIEGVEFTEGNWREIVGAAREGGRVNLEFRRACRKDPPSEAENG